MSLSGIYFGSMIPVMPSPSGLGSLVFSNLGYSDSFGLGLNSLGLGSIFGASFGVGGGWFGGEPLIGLGRFSDTLSSVIMPPSYDASAIFRRNNSVYAGLDTYVGGSREDGEYVAPRRRPHGHRSEESKPIHDVEDVEDTDTDEDVAAADPPPATTLPTAQPAAVAAPAPAAPAAVPAPAAAAPAAPAPAAAAPAPVAEEPPAVLAVAPPEDAVVLETPPVPQKITDFVTNYGGDGTNPEKPKVVLGYDGDIGAHIMFVDYADSIDKKDIKPEKFLEAIKGEESFKDNEDLVMFVGGEKYLFASRNLSNYKYIENLKPAEFARLLGCPLESDSIVATTLATPPGEPEKKKKKNKYADINF